MSQVTTMQHYYVGEATARELLGEPRLRVSATLNSTGDNLNRKGQCYSESG